MNVQIWQKRYDVNEWATCVVFSVNQKFKEYNWIDAMPYTYPCTRVATYVADHKSLSTQWKY